MSTKTPLTPSEPAEPSALVRTTESAPAVADSVRPRPVFADIGELPPELQEAVRTNVQAARAANTLKAYNADTKHFTVWCTVNGLQPFPAKPATIAGYVAALDAEGMKHSTISRRLASIARGHALMGVAKGQLPTASEEVRLVLAGVARRRGRKPEAKDPLLLADLAVLLQHADYGSMIGIRDRAVLLLSFAGAFRSSELAGLNVGDLEFRDEGIVVTVRRSKTDQEGEGMVKGIRHHPTSVELCPVTAVRRWLNIASLIDKADEPLFRGFTKHGTIRRTRMNAETVTEIVKRYCKLAEIDPAKFASHSLRAGHVTQRLGDGEPAIDIMDTTGHTSEDMIKRYDRRKRKNPFATAFQPKEKK